MLRALQPARQLFALARAMFIDVWQMRRAQAEEARMSLAAQIKETEAGIEALLDRIVESSSPSVVRAYEARIEKLERQKIRLSEQAEQTVPPAGRQEELIEPALAFLSNPWNIYEKGCFALKRTVLKQALAEPLRFSRNEG